jgi:hypothetical protein
MGAPMYRVFVFMGRSLAKTVLLARILSSIKVSKILLDRPNDCSSAHAGTKRV